MIFHKTSCPVTSPESVLCLNDCCGKFQEQSSDVSPRKSGLRGRKFEKESIQGGVGGKMLRKSITGLLGRPWEFVSRTHGQEEGTFPLSFPGHTTTS